MKIIYSKEFLESFTGTQEELDAITSQLEDFLMNGNNNQFTDQFTDFVGHSPYNKTTLH